jgi:hypothetical protein
MVAELDEPYPVQRSCRPSVLAAAARAVVNRQVAARCRTSKARLWRRCRKLSSGTSRVRSGKCRVCEAMLEVLSGQVSMKFGQLEVMTSPASSGREKRRHITSKGPISDQQRRRRLGNRSAEERLAKSRKLLRWRK